LRFLSQPEIEPALPDEDYSTQNFANTTNKRIDKNVAATIFARVGYMVTRIGIPPFVLAHIGLQAWGIWSTAFLLVQYLGLSNSGLSNVYIKYIAEYDAKKDYEKANVLLSTGLSFTVPLCTTLFAMIVVFWPFVARFVNLPAAFAHDGKETFLIVFAVFLSSMSLQAYEDLLSGMQEIVMVQWFFIISIVVEMVLIVVLIDMGRGISGLAEAYLARQLVYFFLCVGYDYYKFKWLRVSPYYFSKKALRNVLHFGGIVQIQSIFAILLASPERVLGVRLLGVEAAGIFDLSKKFPATSSIVPMSFFSAFLPAASSLHAHTAGEARTRAIRDLYLRGARQANLTAAYFCSLMAMLPTAIMTVWLGKQVTAGAMTPAQFHAAIVLFAVFNVAMQIHMLTGPGTSILRGIGHIYQEFWYAIPNVVFLVFTLAGVYVFMHGWSILGIGYAVSLATLFAAMVFLYRAHRVLHVSNWSYIYQVLLPGIVPYAAAACFSLPVTRMVSHHSRIAGVGILLVTGVLYTLLFGVVMHTLVLNDNERASWRTLFQRGLNMLSQRS
jgi:O-antigen/teichoic acid export membrane protein